MKERVLLALVGVCSLLALMDFFPGYEKHTHFAFEALPLLYPLFGAMAYVLVVGVGICVRKFAARPEDYYD